MEIVDFEILRDLPTIDNPRFDWKRLMIFSSRPECTLFTKDLNSFAVVRDNYFGFNEGYINFLMARKKGTGSELLGELINKYKTIILLSDPRAEDTLLNYYRNQNLSEVRVYIKCRQKELSYFYTGDIDKEELTKVILKHYGE